MKPYLFLIRGLPGSGKTTLAKTLVAAFYNAGTEVCHTEADQYMTDDNGEYKFDPKKLPAAHTQCQKHTERAMVESVPVIIVSVSSPIAVSMMIGVTDLAVKYGYQVVVMESRGNYKSEHNVPESTLERMRDNWENV